MNHFKRLFSIKFYLVAFFACSLPLFAADTKHTEMDYGDSMFMSLDTNWPEGEHVVRKALVQRLTTQALPEKGTPIGKGRVIKVRDTIENTELDPIYQYQRERSAGYLISMPKGQYKITLQFAEIKRKSEGERIFDIYVQKKLIRENFDAFKETGGQFIAIDINVEKVEVKKFLHLELVQKSTRSTPAIAGIIIENETYSKKINCGSDDAILGYEADWDKNDYMDDPFSTGIIFDTELLKYSAAWINGFVRLQGTAFDATHGTHPSIQGDQVWGSGYLPGWLMNDHNFSDPRPEHLGHLPKDWAHYKGLYRHQDGNIVHYTVQKVSVLDKMELLKIPAQKVGQAYVRTIQSDAFSRSCKMLICETEAKSQNFEKHDSVFKSNDLMISFKGLKPDKLLTHSRKVGEQNLVAVYVDIPKGSQHFSVTLFKSESENALSSLQDVWQSFQPADLKAFTRGGETRWQDTITTRGNTGEDKGPFTIDEITMPENNPWRSWMRPGAFDFSSDGKSMYVSTWSGDVWKVDNLHQMDNLVWKRYAAGLFHPLGLKVVDDRVYVQCRDQIVILDDLNQDDEADHYINFNNDVVITENFHEFSFELHRDKAGNFYFIKGAPVIAGGEGFGDMKVHHGKLFKVSPDGSKLEVIASGFRAPNGLGISPDGQLSTSDNEGNWVAATPINWVETGGFYGVQPTYAGADIPEKRSPIICWIPHKVDNSAGGQVWVPQGEWGPYGGEMFHLSYGQATLFHVLKEEVEGQIQGGVVDLKPSGSFEAGIMRGRFNPTDSAIYVCGLKGWQTKGIKDGGIYRVRYTGQAQTRPLSLNIGSNGIKIKFSAPLKAESALDAGNFHLSQWVYEISDKYGSKHFKVPKDRVWDLKSEWSPLPQAELDKFNAQHFSDEAAKKAAKAQLYEKYIGEDQLKINSLSLSEDKTTLFIELPDITPVMQMKVSFDIEDAEGQKVKHDIYNTIHKRGAWKGKPGKKILDADLNKPQSGLIASYTHRGQNKVDHRVERMAAIHIAEHAPVTQYLDHGPFNAQLSGFIKVERNMEVDLFLGGSGSGTLSINGALLFQNQSFNLHQAYPVQLKKGYNKLNFQYFGPDKGESFFRLYWQALEYFPKEPIPAKVLFHEAGDQELIKAQEKRLGLELTLQKNCFNCHDAGENVSLPELKDRKISLENLGTRLNAAWVSEWIMNPKNLRAHANMPVMLKNLPESEWSKAAKDISAYLTTEATETSLPQGDQAQGETLFGNFGCASCHSMDDNEASISLKYVGFKFKPGQIAEFLLEPRRHNPWINMPDFQLSDQESVDLEHYLRAATKPRQAEKIQADPTSGRQYFEKLNCAACHDFKEHQTQPKIAIWGKSGSCLNDHGGGKPKYEISQKERKAISSFLQTGQEALKHRDPVEFANRQIKSHQCMNCHTRDGKSSNWKSPHTLPSALPPSLTHTGEKLHGKFLSRILKGELNEKMRPWMKAKMPSFPQEADLFATGINAAHGFSHTENLSHDSKQSDVGGGLILQNGFACIVCHAAGSQKALAPFGAPGPNLDLAAERLRHEYYLRWMLNPQRAEPTTHMTKFSSDHVKTALGAFDGDARKQFNAIWDYIQTLK